jgi:serine/threonine protein kinase
MLTQDHVVGIYNGTYRKWSDTSIQRVNPNVTLPNEYIKVVARGDRSGLTEVFTATLGSFSPEWKRIYGSFSGGKNVTSGEQSTWNNDTISYFGVESKGMIGIILSFHYTIGYLSVADAVESGLNKNAALIQNLEGQYTCATTTSVESAMQYFSRLTSNLTFVLGNAGGLNSYPITGFTYIVMRRSYIMQQCDIIKELIRYIDWFMTEKLQRDECKNFGMTPLSFELVDRIQTEVLRKITCNGLYVWNEIATDLANEKISENAWIYPVKIVVPCLSIIFIGLVTYIIKQKIHHWKQLYNDDWFIPIEDITFFYESRNSSSEKSKLFSKKSVWSLNAIAENSFDRKMLDQIIQWPGIWNSNTIGLRLICLPLTSISRPLKTHMLWLRGKIAHQNIVKFWGLTELERDKYVIGDFCEKGSLADILHDNKLNLGNDLKRALAIDVAQGMWYLHSREIIHGNLTSAVCLIDSKWTIKISDWEFVSLLRVYKDNIYPLKELRKISILGKDDTRYIEAVRDFWVAPEILRQEFCCNPTKQSDVYSYAIVIQEIYTREEPYAEHSDILNPKDVIEAVKLNNLRPSTSEDIPIVIRQVMEIAWCDNPLNRANFEEILKMIKQSGKERKSVLDSMMEAMEDYTAYLEDKVGDKSSETRALATKLENMCKDIVPPCMITYIMQGDSFSSDNYIYLGIVVVNFSDIEYLMHVLSPRMMFTNINRLYQDLASIGRKFNAYNLSAAGNTLLFAVTSSKNENNELLIYESTAKFCLAITKYMLVENHKDCENGFIGLKIGAHIGSGLISILGPSCPRYTVFSSIIEETQNIARTSKRSKVHISQNFNDVIKETFITKKRKNRIPSVSIRFVYLCMIVILIKLAYVK